jgi:ribosomal protein S27E
MAEIILITFLTLISWAFFVMLRCPNCRKIKSVFSQERKKVVNEDGRETISCRICNHSYKRLPLSGGTGGDGGFE